MRKRHTALFLSFLLIFTLFAAVLHGCDSTETTADALTLGPLPDTLSVGEQIDCPLGVSPSDAAADIVWTSSDEDILSVENGSVTALSVGTAEIQVCDCNSLLACSAELTVVDDSLERTARCITDLCSANCDGDTVDALYAQLDTLSRAKSDDAAIAREALGGLIDIALCADNAPSVADISAALGLDTQTVMTAAEVLHMRSQMSDSSVTMTFTGDCTFGYLNEYDSETSFPTVYRNAGSVTYPFDRVRHIFAADDLTVINFEGTLAEEGTATADKRFHFRGEPEYVGILSGSSVEVANLANNHSFDYLQEGFDRTVALLEAQSVSVIHNSQPLVTDINDIEVVMLAAGDSIQPYIYMPSVEQLLEQIRKFKRADNIVVVNIHWGGEYSKVPEKGQISAAHSLIDAGADIVIGHHPHIIQGIELYNGKVIAYSLGNFSFGGRYMLVENETFILRASFGRSSDGTVCMNEWSVVPCSSSGGKANDYQPHTLSGDRTDSMVRMLIGRSNAISDIDSIPYFRCE